MGETDWFYCTRLVYGHDAQTAMCDQANVVSEVVGVKGSQMNIAPNNFGCKKCGREAGAIPGCPERRSGSCSFVEEWRRRKNVVLWVGGLITLISACLGMSLFHWMWSLLPLVATIALWLITNEVQYYSAEMNTGLRRTTVGGFELDHKWIKSKLLQSHFKPTQPFQYPLSITALFAESKVGYLSKAVDQVFRAALINLLVEESIEVLLLQNYKFGEGESKPSAINDYVITVAHNRKKIKNAGKLETHIIWALQAGKGKAWSGALSIYDLVREVYQEDKLFPEGWLVDLVAQDAMDRGLCQVDGSWIWRGKKIKWGATHISRIKDEQQIARALSKQLADDYPEFSLVLDKQISKGIQSRNTDDGD